MDICTAEDLDKQVHQYKASETRRYRDHVCYLFNLHFERIGGDGNCFFESVVTLLAHVQDAFGHNHMLTATQLRERVVDWLKRCDSSDGNVGQECTKYMTQELNRTLEWKEGRKTTRATPETIVDYLAISAKNGVWIEGRLNSYQYAYTAIHCHTPPYTTLHHPTPPYITLHHPTPPYTAIHHPTPPYTTIHHPTPPYTTIHHPTPPYTTLHHPTPPYTTLHHPTPSYTIQHHPTPSYTTIRLPLAYRGLSHLQRLCCCGNSRSPLRQVIWKSKASTYSSLQKGSFNAF